MSLTPVSVNLFACQVLGALVLVIGCVTCRAAIGAGYVVSLNPLAAPCRAPSGMRPDHRLRVVRADTRQSHQTLFASR